MLDVSGLNVSYGEVTVVENLTVSLEPGTLTALVGPNGTGKSSLLKAVAGLIPTGGSVRLNGGDALDIQDRMNDIAYMPQDVGLASSLTVFEVMLLGRLRSLSLRVSRQLHHDVDAALKRFGLVNLVNRTLSEISGGQRQMVYLAQSLFRDPSVLFLDEPTAALDLRHQLVVLDHVRHHCKTHNTIGVSAMHDLSLAARYCERMIFLSDGAVVADGAPADILKAQLLRDVYGVEVEIVAAPNGTLHVTPIEAISTAANTQYQ